VGKERPLFPVRKVLQGGGYRRPLLILEHPLIRGVRVRHVDNSMLVPTLSIAHSPH
jgi:hypothetical protein